MDNRKPRRKALDDLVLTKSAAWAWHQRRPEFNAKPMMIDEFHGLRNKVDPKPSRYKLEAMKRNKEEETFNLNSPPKFSSLRSKSVHVASSLLDEYEIERIFKAFDYYSKSARTKHYSGGGRKAEEEVEATEMKSTKSFVKKNKSKWIYDVITCGLSINDVVKSTSFEYSRLRSRSKKSHVAVVNDVGCRYRFQGRGDGGGGGGSPANTIVNDGFRNSDKYFLKIYI